MSNALAGNVPGIIARQTSGQPGKSTSEFWIRGISTFGASSSAYILVDGFERSSLDELNIEDIESFTVLKDASATAIYGSKGANGVVLITTKRGKAGKINIDAKVETSYNTRTITPEFVDGLSYASLMNEALVTRNLGMAYQPEELELFRTQMDPDFYPNVDWMDLILKNGAWSYRANLNMNGGGNTARYFVSASYTEDQGAAQEIDAASVPVAVPVIGGIAAVFIAGLIAFLVFTSRHSIGVAEKAAQFAKYIGYDVSDIEKMYLAGALHDIGKMAVGNEILEKPDKLTDEEFDKMKNHAGYTYLMLSQVDGFEDIRDWAALHHEKLNGKGYPFGKTADELNEQERIMACVDIYQALTEERPYKKGMSHEKTCDILDEMAEKGFVDADISRKMRDCFH